MHRSAILHLRALLPFLAISLAAAPHALANDIWSEDCESEPKHVFEVDDTVCVMGDVDYLCPGDNPLVDVPGADVYIVPTGAAPFSVPPVHFDTYGGAGGFWNIQVWIPPLVPGVYDIVMDEKCDGVWEPGVDVRVDQAFEVLGELTCTFPPTGYQPMSPGIASGADCRGACGKDCPDTCTPAPVLDVCEEDVDMCQHVECQFTGLVCGSHDGCRIHDDCYDACAVSTGAACDINPGSPSFGCCRSCDIDCVNSYGLLCGSWMAGDGPYDTNIYYADNNGWTATGPSPGLCDGDC